MALFSNLRLYRLHSEWPATETELSEALAAQAFKPCGSLTERSSGWESPVAGPAADPMADPTADKESALCRRVSGADLIRLRSQTRVLPAAAVKEALEERVTQFTARTARAPSRKEKRDMKDDLYHELLPKALVKSDRINGFYLRSENVIGVDTASDKDAERFIDILREALGSVLVTPLAFNQPLGEFLTKLYLGSGPTQFLVGRECRMQDPGNAKTSVQWSDIDICDSDVRKHVGGGLRLERLGLEFDEVIRCVLDREGVFRKLKLLGMEDLDEPLQDMPLADRMDGPVLVGEGGGAPDQPPSLALSPETALARLDAEFVLFTGTFTRLLTALKKVLEGYAELTPTDGSAAAAG